MSNSFTGSSLELLFAHPLCERCGSASEGPQSSVDTLVLFNVDVVAKYQVTNVLVQMRPDGHV